MRFSLPRVSFLLSFCVLIAAGLCKAAPEQDSAKLDHRKLDRFINESGEPKPIKTAADWQKRRASILANMQAVMGPLPKQAQQERPVDFEVLDQTETDDFTRQTIRFNAEPGDPVVADLYTPKAGDASNRPAMVALHPTGAQGKRIVAGEGPRNNRQYAIELAKRGYVVIAPDYPSFGDLKDYSFADDEYVSGTMKGIVNHMRCVDVLRSLDGVDDNRIGVIGHSLGGHNALFLAAFDERVKVAVTSCGWTPFHDYKEGNLTGWTSDRYMPKIRTDYDLDPNRVPFDFPEIIAAIAPRGVFSSSPTNDDNFDVEGARRGIAEASKIFTLLDAPNQLQLLTPPCDHDFPTEIRADAYKFIDQNLDHKPLAELDFGSELPRIPAVELPDVLDSFKVVDGYKIELTAAEPMVVDPVAMSFDENGALYVVEMRGYSEDDGQNLGRIRVLTDEDGDGTFDKSEVFADGLSWPTAIICYDDGIFIGAAPDIIYLKDTDGDQQADEKKVVFTGFGKRNVQALLNSFRWGLDNRIYGATSSNGGVVKRPEQPDSAGIDLRGRNFSFDPKSLELRPESGAAQHGMAFDDWGRMFVCSNSNHFQMVMYEDRYAARNRYLKAPSSLVSVADDGAQAEVFRISPLEPWRIVRTRLRASGRVKGVVEFGGKYSGYFTSATGINFFRGDGWSKADRGTAIIGDVGNNIVHRKQVYDDGILRKGKRIDVQTEMIASTDIWFRPVQYENGPDGALHVLDMYRETIEHPWSLPEEIKKFLDLTSGRDRGRLYRITGEDFQQRPVPQLAEANSSTLVDLLDHPNAWHRETASRLLYERQDPQTASLVRSSFEKMSALGKMHALYVLLGADALDESLIARSFDDIEPQLRRHAVRLSEQFPESSLLQQKLAASVNDPAPAVRYQLAFTLGTFPHTFNAPLIADLLKESGSDSWMRFALLTSVDQQLPQIMNALADDGEFLKSSAARPVLESLTELIARRGNAKEVDTFATNILNNAGLDYAFRSKLYGQFAAAAGGKSQQYASLNEWRDEFLKQARANAENEDAPIAQRLDGVAALSVSTNAKDRELLLDLLDPRSPEAIQLAALNTLVAIGGEETDDYLIEVYPQFSPTLRKQAQVALFSRPTWTASLLKAVIANQLPKADLDRSQLQILKTSKSKELQKLAGEVSSLFEDSSRNVVIDRYRPALDMSGDIDHGRQLFVKSCSSCHKLEGKGKAIGPNLASFKNRGKEAVLTNLLDPNREVTPDYLTYVVVTADGRTYTGMLANQSATTISLQRAEGEPLVLLRADIEEMRTSGISLMPEGLEKDLDVDAVADLLAYLMQAE